MGSAAGQKNCPVHSRRPIRLVVLSDLHNSEFGAYNSELVDKVRRLSPDVILIAGDMVNKNDPNTLRSRAWGFVEKKLKKRGS